MDKKMKYPNVKMQDFYWEPSYRIGDGLAVMADRMKRPPPGGICPEQDPSSGPRGPPFEVSSSQVMWRRRRWSCSVTLLLFLLVFSDLVSF